MTRNRSGAAWRAVTAVAAVVLALAGCGGVAPPPSAAPAPPLGSAPLVERTPAGFDADLRALRGRVVVVNFWASWCGPCRRETPELVRAAAAWRGRPVTVVGVDSGDARAAALAFLERNHAGFPTVFDPKGVRGGIAAAWTVTGLPQTWFVAPDGTRAGRVVGAVTGAELRQRVDDLLPG